MIDLIHLGYILVTALVGLITAAVIYARWEYGRLERIKGLHSIVKPGFIGGSDTSMYKKIVHHQDQENVKKYGKVFGFYEGRQAQIYIADPELIKHILVKDFDHFHNKRIMDFGHELINKMLDILPYDKWKVVRSILSPTFTTGKLRSMSLAMTDAINEWIDTVKAKLDNDGVPFSKALYTGLATDVIARCGFGMRLNSLHDPNNVFVQHVHKFIGTEGTTGNFMVNVVQTFPFLATLFPLFPPPTLCFFRDLIKDVMTSRRDTKVKLNDFIDCLNEMHEKLQTDEYKKLEITETTIMAQALIFFLAGFETSSSTLIYTTYNLAKNPDCQHKLVEEVDAYLERHNGKIEHETIGELSYLSACVQETLRMFAPLIRLERVCTKAWTHEPSGLHIPEGMVIQIPVYGIHYNPEYYPDPYTFKPERFLPESKDKLNPYTFLSFGQGNHNCIGMRFAKEEIYLALTNVMKNFTFKPTADTKIKYLPGLTFLFGVEPFSVEAVKRK